MPTSNGKPDLYSVADAAEEIGINPKNLLQWIVKSKLPATKIGRLYVIRREDLEAFKRDREENVRVQAQRQSAAP